jgi:hypothetical protein
MLGKPDRFAECPRQLLVDLQQFFVADHGLGVVVFRNHFVCRDPESE